MADCNDTLREMYVFLDDEIPSGLKQRIDAHLTDCPDCQGAFEFHVELKALIAAKCAESLPPGLADRIANCFGDVEVDDTYDPLRVD
jgi:mycothiol system anti-sigma-R factor